MTVTKVKGQKLSTTTNTMKKIITSSLVLLTCAFSAQADLLYFLVDGYTPEGPTKNFDYAVLGVAMNVDGMWVTSWNGGNNVYLDIQPTADSAAGASKILVADNSGTYSLAGPAWADVSSYKEDYYAFYIETYLYGINTAIWSFDEKTAQSYSQLLASNHIYVNDISTPYVTAWAIPEPTSGMLFLLGIAALFLRRKRSKVEG